MLMSWVNTAPGWGVTEGRKQPAWLEPGRPGQSWEFPPPSTIQAPSPFLLSLSSRVSISSRHPLTLLSVYTDSPASKSYVCVSSWALPSIPLRLLVA